jgi:hypothetical protein
MREGYTPAAHAFSLCRAHAQRPTLGLDREPTKLSHLHPPLRRVEEKIKTSLLRLRCRWSAQNRCPEGEIEGSHFNTLCQSPAACQVARQVVCSLGALWHKFRKNLRRLACFALCRIVDQQKEGRSGSEQGPESVYIHLPEHASLLVGFVGSFYLPSKWCSSEDTIYHSS